MALMNTGVSLLALVLLIHSVVGQGYVRTEIGCSARCLAKCFNDESPNGAEVQSSIPQKCWDLCSYYKGLAFGTACQSSDSTCAVTCLNISIGESDVSNDLKLQPTNLRYDLVETTAKTRRTNLVRLIWDSLQSEAYGQPVYIIQIRNSSNSGSLWQTLPVVNVNNSMIEIPSPCSKYDFRVFSAFEQGISRPSKTVTTEIKQPGQVTALQLKKIYYRSRKKFVYLDIGWGPPTNWLTRDIKSYNVSVEFVDCKLDKKVTEIWPALKHKLDNSETASIMFPDIYADKGCRLLFEITNVVSVCGSSNSNSKSFIIIPLSCEQQVILNFPCNTAKLTTTSPLEAVTMKKAPGFDLVGNLSCLHDGINYEIAEIEADDEVSLEVRWAFPTSIVNLTYFWLRYGKLRRHQQFDPNLSIDEDDNVVITLSKDTTQTVVTDLEMDTEYGFQICAAFGPNQPQPHWDDVSYQLIKVDRTSINSLCSMRLEYTQDKRKLEGSGATRHFVRLQWEMPDGVESMGPIYAKWGFARKTSTGFEDLEFQGRTEIKQISMKTKSLIMDNVQPGSTYGIQICAFDASVAPTATLWLSHSRIFPIFVAQEPPPTIAAKTIEEKKASSVWLYTCVIVMAIVAAMSTIIAVFCHVFTSRGHTIGTVRSQLSTVAWRKGGRSSSIEIAVRARKLGREESNLQTVLNSQRQGQQLRI